MPTRATNLVYLYFDIAWAFRQEAVLFSATTPAWMRLCIASNELNTYVRNTHVL